MQANAPVIAEGLFSYQIGGSERVGVDLAIEYARRGYRVVCFAFYDSDGPMKVELKAAGIRCIDLNYERLSGASRRLRYQWQFLRMLRTENVSALHVHHATALILCGVPAWLARVRRVVMSEHGLHQLKDRPPYLRSARFYCRFATDITVVEAAQADYFRTELQVPTARLHCIPNGVRISNRSAAARTEMRRGLGIPQQCFSYFYVGRLNAVKDLGTLLAAFAALPADVAPDSRLHIVGDGPERGALEAKCRELKLHDRVAFLGARQDVRELLTAADAFVMSSITEGLPMALLEAIATSVPCVATSVGGIPKLLAEGRGLLAPPRAPDQLAEAMAQLARSPELRKSIVSNAMDSLLREYSLEAAADEYLKLLGLPPTAA